MGQELLHCPKGRPGVNHQRNEMGTLLPRRFGMRLGNSQVQAQAQVQVVTAPADSQDNLT